MAALDFPLSPTNGQTYGAPNGVTYVWSAAQSLWLVQGPTVTGAVGDFCAATTTNPTLPNVATPYVFATVLSGNQGGWYNTSNGRYTPPAGRYAINVSASAGNTVAASNVFMWLRKNGANVLFAAETIGAANFACDIAINTVLEANGSDYFDVLLWAGLTTTVTNQAAFSAFPLTGVQGPPGPVGTPVVGDFCAYSSATGTINTTPTVIAPNTILTGNSGGYYNTSNGRYTPPAGRYAMSAQYYANNPVGISNYSIQLRKNGVGIGVPMINLGPLTGNNTFVSITAEIEANGTDYFEVVGASSAAAANIVAPYITAFPLSGLAGPQGPMPVGNYWRQLKRVVPVAGQATVDFVGADIPSDINNLMFSVANVVPQTNEVNLFMRVYNGSGVVDSSSNYGTAMTSVPANAAFGVAAGSGGITTTACVFAYAVANEQVNNNATFGISVEGRVGDIKNAKAKHVTWQSQYFNGAGSVLRMASGGSTFNGTDKVITGLQFLFQTGNFAAGGAITLWGSP